MANLCHLHGHSFREISLNVFQVCICCRSSKMLQLKLQQIFKVKRELDENIADRCVSEKVCMTHSS